VINIDNKVIGTKIKEHRKRKKLTQRELANLIDKAEISVRKYENGTIQVPNDVLQQIAKVLDTTIIDLMGWDDEIQPIVRGMDGLRLMLEHIYDSVDFEEYKDTGSYDVVLTKDGEKTVMPEIPYEKLFEFLCKNIPMFIEMINSQYNNKE
jgi:transcriptional regulator with XRE-family HTH domain